MEDLFSLAQARDLLGREVRATARLTADGRLSATGRFIQPGERGTVTEARRAPGSEQYQLTVSWAERRPSTVWPDGAVKESRITPGLITDRHLVVAPAPELAEVPR